MASFYKKYNFFDNFFWDKLNRYSNSIGLKVTYTSLLLYYAFKRKETSSWAKSMILGMLSYFLSPIDIIPDLTPFIGYTDDFSITVLGLLSVGFYINDEIKTKARAKIKVW